MTRDDGGDADLVEISGAIKWFDVAKGYGFILPDGGKTGDILLHVTCLRRDGFQTALEGARVVCLAKQGERGMQAFRVLSMDTIDGRASGRNAGAAHACRGDARKRARARAGQMVQPHQGLRLPDPRRGHGRHLRPHGDAAPLRHHRARPGQVVLVRFGRGDKGLMAAEIHPDMGTLPVSH